MLESLKKEMNKTYTENGGAAYRTTGSYCLDLFASIGALRRQPQDLILGVFIRAFSEDPDLAMKILFYARDVRGGLGERRVFKVILRWLAMNSQTSVKKNMEYIAEYGRYDDLLSLMDTPCEKDMLALVKEQLDRDLLAAEKDQAVSLLGKWLPSVNASNPATAWAAKKVARSLGYTDAQYRKVLSLLRAKIKIIENNLREREYTFDYSKQPSRAMFKYRAAFARNDCERYQSFINDVRMGNAKLHADNVMPYELVDPYLARAIGGRVIDRLSNDKKDILNATWESMPDFGGNENILPVIDTSGSMYAYHNPMPASVALSLGLYFAERNKGIFKNHFIEFSRTPQLIELKGETFVDRLKFAASFSEIANTNVQAVFDTILTAAIKNRVSKDELPSKLVIISDMEFDYCMENASLPIFEMEKKKYAKCGYELPQIIFWNVASRNVQQPVTMNEQGCALVSGVTPRIFAMIASGQVSPYKMMMDIIGSKRYERIAA